MSVGIVREIWRYPVKSMAGERLERSDVGTNGLWGDRGWAIRDEVTGEIHNAKRYPALMQCSARYREAPAADRIPYVDITFPDRTVLGSDAPQLAAKLSELIGHKVALHALRPASDTGFYRRREAGSNLLGAVARYRAARRVLSWIAQRGLAGGNLREEFGRRSEEPLPDLSEMPAEVFEYYTPPGTFFDVMAIHVLTTGTLARMAQLNPNGSWDVRRFRPNIFIETADDETMWAGRNVAIGDFVIRAELPTARCAMPTHPQAELAADPSVLRTIVRESGQCLGMYATVQKSGSVAAGDSVSLA